MDFRIHNSPDVDRLKTQEIIKPGDTNRERQFGTGYSYQQSNLGNDGFQLSEEYTNKTRAGGTEQSTGKMTLLKLIFLLFCFCGLLFLITSAVIAMGGVLSTVVLSLLIFFGVFLYSINLNPFEKDTYKKLFAILFG